MVGGAIFVVGPDCVPLPRSAGTCRSSSVRGVLYCWTVWKASGPNFLVTCPAVSV